MSNCFLFDTHNKLNCTSTIMTFSYCAYLWLRKFLYQMTNPHTGIEETVSIKTTNNPLTKTTIWWCFSYGFGFMLDFWFCIRLFENNVDSVLKKGKLTSARFCSWRRSVDICKNLIARCISTSIRATAFDADSASASFKIFFNKVWLFFW
jgi:hypothetical protein